MAAGGTARAEEVRKFGALAERWWDPRGPMAPLHAMNPLRTGWVAARAGGLAGKRVLDVGCGAGLASEAFARMGAEVVGMDAAPEALAAARPHAEAGGLTIDYREGGPEDLADGDRFDVVVALEVIEHVEARAAFIAALARAVAPGGVLVMSTLNRTPRAFLMAKLGAEYLLRLLPVGTHDWRMFVTPGELGALLRREGFRVTDVAGMVMHPITREWRESRDLGVNYIIAARR
ncbi:MAG: bifunctional 2-polyprenyl-6-hydroxyphenol methylase/3-demethylubiquinol 3-O-methyltransferase UbiG [Pseudomonadota bacterium]